MQKARSYASIAKSYIRKLAGPAVVALGFIAAATGQASAVTATCNGGEATSVSISAAFAAPCDFGSGNLNGANNDGFLSEYAASGYVTLAKSDSANAFLPDASVWLTKPQGPGTVSSKGSFALVAALLQSYHSLVIAFKQADGWVAFFLPDIASALSGQWWTATGGLSHANVYAKVGAAPISAVPVPAGMALAATGLGMLGLLGWRRKRVVEA